MRRALALVLLAAGCFTNTVRSGAPLGEPADGWDERWHSGMLFGSVELSGPYDLEKVCPHGWAEISGHMGPLNVVLTILTFDIYSSQVITVRCAAGAPVAQRITPRHR